MQEGTRRPFRLTLALFPLTLAVLALAACGTTRDAILSPAEALSRDEVEGVSAELRFLDDQFLKKQFGTEANPFLTEYYRISFRRILVFELNLRNQSGKRVELDLRRCELDYGAKQTPASSRSGLADHWESMQEDRRYLAEKDRIIERWVLPDRAVVADGATRYGYLVFLGNLPREGAATVHVPVFYEGGAANLRFKYNF